MGKLDLDKKKIFDISPLISEKTATFPGDIPFSRHISKNFDNQESYSLSSINMSLHTGAHADAPSHYHSKGQSIDEVSLKYYLGSCQVVRLSIKRKKKIEQKDLEGKKIQSRRILFATGSYPNPDQWQNNFSFLSVSLVQYLSRKNVLTLGIDTPSIDPANSKELKAHKEAFKKKIALLEGLILTHVPEGVYQLIALPLKISKGEASPVRAVLIS